MGNETLAILITCTLAAFATVCVLVVLYKDTGIKCERAVAERESTRDAWDFGLAGIAAPEPREGEGRAK